MDQGCNTSCFSKSKGGSEKPTKSLFDEGFVISGFKLKSSASEKELTSSIKKLLSDKMAFIPGSPKFNFVCAVEKKIVKICTAEEITGELLKHFCGPELLT